jgi:hypothetical protein
VLIDLSGVTFMDSAGLRALLRVVELDDGKTLIVQPSRQVFKLLHLASLVNGELSNVEVREPHESCSYEIFDSTSLPSFSAGLTLLSTPRSVICSRLGDPSVPGANVISKPP